MNFILSFLRGEKELWATFWMSIILPFLLLREFWQMIYEAYGRQTLFTSGSEVMQPVFLTFMLIVMAVTSIYFLAAGAAVLMSAWKHQPAGLWGWLGILITALIVGYYPISLFEFFPSRGSAKG